MAAVFELWDVDTGNAVGEYETEAAALAVVQQALLAPASGGAESLALVRVDRRGHSRVLAKGRTLVDRARSAMQSVMPSSR
jgi:hypothetical protein